MKPEDFGLKVDNLKKRKKRFAKQRQKRGWDDTETWSLFSTLAEWLVPRLKRFKKLNDGCHPSDITSKQWDKAIDEMIEGFKLIAEDICAPNEDQTVKMDRALDIFRDRFFSLWW